jgi:single-strand DNA-binding protein
MSNSVTIVGNMTSDPELRFTNSGMPVASFGVAINSGRRNQQTGKWEEGEASFFDVVCFRELADNVAESLTKGTRVVVVGRLNQRSWETDSGEKRSKVEIVADEIAPSLRWATATVHRTERREGMSDADGV